MQNKLVFKPVELSDRDLMSKYLHQTGMYGCDNSFVTQYLWQEAYHTEWALFQNALVIKVSHWGKNYFMAPFGLQDDDALALADALQNYTGGVVCFDGVYENQLPIVKKMFPQVEFVSSPDESDYIYLQSELSTFTGRKFHGQKNHLNAFYKAHPDVEYETIDKHNAEECLQFALEWCEERSAKDITILDEQVALKKSFAHFEELGLRGGALRFDGKIQAMSVGDKFLDDIADLHFEKARKGVRGLYVAMCQAFAKNAWSDVVYLNREEDMGLEGLRKAKQDLHPVMMWKRYSAVIK